MKLLALRTIQWLMLSIINLAMGLFALIFVNWWAPFLARQITPDEWLGQVSGGVSVGLQRLPRWLAWFDTFDASTDAGWHDGYFMPAGSYTKAAPPPFWLRKWWQVCWLYRNTAYAFAYGPMGIPMHTDSWRVLRFTQTEAGMLFIAFSTTGYWNIAYGGRFGSYKLGWKAWNYFLPDSSTWRADSWGPSWRTQIVLSINPFKRG